MEEKIRKIEEELLIKDEIIKMLETTLHDLEKENDLLKRTVTTQSRTNQKLFKDNIELKKKKKKEEIWVANYTQQPLGYNPYQE